MSDSESQAGSGDDTETVESFEVLADAKYVRLTTFRRDGTPVSTPLWCAVDDGLLYLSTGEKTGKLKRIRNNAHVTIGRSNARGEPRGPAYAAEARILSGDESERARSRVAARHLMSRPIGFIYERILRQGVSVGVEVKPSQTSTP
jgi:PPOX class probable F420-dependent enzyme